MSDDTATGPSETPSVNRKRNELKRRRYELRNGLRKPKLTPKIQPVTGKSEFGPDGQELATKVGLHWLHTLGMALVAAGVAWDSRVTAKGARPGFTRIELQSVKHETTLGLTAAGSMWTSHEIPNGAINNQDTRWVLKAILSRQQADLVLAHGSLRR